MSYPKLTEILQTSLREPELSHRSVSLVCKISTSILENLKNDKAKRYFFH